MPAKKEVKEKPVEFDLKRFRQAKFERRTFEYPVNGTVLADFFPKTAKKKVFVLQSLNGMELSDIRSAVNERKAARQLITGMEDKGRIDAIKSIINIDAAISDRLYSLIKFLQKGVQSPFACYR